MKKYFGFVLLLVLAISASLFVGCGKVDFKLNFIVDGEVYDTISTNGKEAIKLPANPEKEGYVFDGWYWDNEVWKRPFTANSLLDTPLSSDMSVYAKFEKEEAVKGTQAEFVGFEKTGENKYLKKVPNDTEIFSLGTSVKVNSKSSWQLSSDVYGNNVIASKTATLSVGDNYYYVNVIADDGTMQLYVLNIRRREIYTVTFADCDVQPQYIEEDSCVVAPATANRTGYTFESWNFDFTAPIVENTIINAKWNVVTYNIEYDLNGGENNSENPTTYTIESEDIILQTPSKTGYDFAGWYSDSRFSKRYYRIYSGSYDNLTLYAKWTHTVYSIEYELNGGKNNSLNPPRYTIESNEIVLQEASKTGYNFAGWYADETFSEKVEKIEKGTLGRKKFYAKWQIITYSIEYELNGGENDVNNPTTYTVESEDIVLKKPSKTDYDFVGWYEDEDFSKKVDKIFKGSSANKKFYVKWAPTVYNIEYELNGGENNFANPTTYTIESEDIVLQMPSKTGYDFVGWFANEAFSKNADKISAGSRGNKKFYAKWIKSIFKYTEAGEITGLSVTEETITELIIPNMLNGVKITSIGSHAFWRCEKITTVIIPDSVRTIYNAAFWGCVKLMNIVIQNSIEYIGDGVFLECDSLNYNEYDNAYYIGCDENPYVVLIKAKSTDIASCSINEKTRIIYSSAFQDCEKIKNLTIPNSVINSGNYIFDNCIGLANVYIGSGLVNIGESAFRNCIELTDVIIPNSVVSIGIGAFTLCTSLKSITIPYSVTNIEWGAFSYCTELVSVEVDKGNRIYHSDNNCIIETKSKKLILGYKNGIIPEGVEEIGDYAFSGCVGLVSVTIPNGVTSIGNLAFSDCTNLVSVSIPNSVITIGDYAFCNCRSLTDINGIIPEGVEEIGDYAFSGCVGLVSVTIPNGVTSIGNLAFSDCTNLVSVSIPNSVITIGDYAFCNCRSLTDIIVPDSVTSIGNAAFKGCDSLLRMTIPFVGESRIANNGYNQVFGYIFGYETNSDYNEPIGTTYQYASGRTNYHYYIPLGLRRVVITDDNVGYYAFFGCEKLTDIILGEGVTTIGYSAFHGCTGLTSVTIPNSVKNIACYAFSNCTSLKTIYYKGTKEQWNAITKGISWNYNTGYYTIIYNA